MKSLMNLLLIGFAVFLLLPESVEAKKTVYVRGYYRKDGTYVRPHTRGSGGSSSWSPSTISSIKQPSPPPSKPDGSQDWIYVEGYFRSDGTYVPAHRRRKGGTSPGTYRASTGSSRALGSSQGTSRISPSFNAPVLTNDGVHEDVDEQEVEVDQASQELADLSQQFSSQKSSAVFEKIEEFCKRFPMSQAAKEARSYSTSLRDRETNFERAILKLSQDVGAVPESEASSILKEIVDASPLSDFQDTATQLLASVEQRADETNSEFQRLLQQESMLPRTEFVASLKSLAKRYPGSSAASNALLYIEKIDKDEWLAEEELTLIQTLVRNGRISPARARIEELLRKYPLTAAAVECQRLLKKLDQSKN